MTATRLVTMAGRPEGSGRPAVGTSPAMTTRRRTPDMATATTTKTHITEQKGAKKGPAVTRVGNITADPELRFSEKGNPYTRLRIAVDVPKVPGDWAGERETTFYGVTCFGSLAENVAESLRKGDRIVVTGRPESRTWTGDDGKEHTEKVILADALGPELRFATAVVTKMRDTRPAATSAWTEAEEEAF